MELTQYDMANNFFVNQSTFAAYESGKAMPSVGALIDLSKFFGVSTDYLLGLTDISDFSKGDLDIKEKELLLIYTELSSKLQENLLSYADFCLQLEAKSRIKADSMPTKKHTLKNLEAHSAYVKLRSKIDTKLEKDL